MIQFIPFENDGLSGIKAVENAEEIGFCTFKIDGFDLIFKSVECDDDIITEGIARAAMNYAANRYAYIAKISEDIVSPAFIRLGFAGNDVFSVEIPAALTSGCSCGH